MAAMWVRKVLSAAVRLTVLLQHGGTHKCTVTQADDQTTYDVQDLSGFRDAEASKCTFTWSNALDTVVGTHNDRMEPVTSSSFGRLVSSKCMGNMTFNGACELEGTAQDYTASCIASCVPVREGNSWIVGVVIVLLLLLLLGLLGFLCYKYETWRKCSCRQTGGFYNPVKFQTHQQAADVESGKAAVQDS